MFLTAPGVRENRSQVKPGRAVSELSTAHTSIITRPPAHLNPPNTHSSLSPSPTACPYPRQTEAAAATSRSEPWRRSPNPIAHSAKAPPPPSLLSARRLVAAEPTQRATHSQQPVPVPSSLSLEPQRPVPTPAQPRRQRQRAEASLGGDHPTPSRIARKPHLPPSLLSARRLVAAEPTQRATHPQQPVPGAPGAPTACPYPRQTEAAAATSRSEPWRRSPNPIAHSAKAPPPPEPPQRAQARSRGAHPNEPPIPGSLSLEPLKQPVPKAPPATTWRPQLNTGFLDARERVRFPQSFGTNPEHVHEQHR
jgi:hypothetical protein